MKVNKQDSIYPLTIVQDRYTGSYSAGLFTAWNLEPQEVPEEIYGDDTTCMSFWQNNILLVGKGATPDDSVEDLIKKIRIQGRVDTCVEFAFKSLVKSLKSRNLIDKDAKFIVE